MKKVGILSMQRIVNYGSFLQAYGLMKTIEGLGYEVEFVDYEVKPCVETNLKETIKCWPLVRDYMDVKIRHNKKKSNRPADILAIKYENEFLPILGISKKKKYRSKVDTLVIGSDEVFNCLQDNTNVGFSTQLFGAGTRANKLISYAASFGNTTKERLDKYGKTEDIADLLSKFDSISVRDKNSIKIVNEITTKKAEYHLDPVLIYDFTEEISKQKVEESNYIIVYAYAGRITTDEAEIVKEYAKKNNCQLISIGGIQEFCDKHLTLSPFEVLALFKNANGIITDTFHGSIMSIINHKQFVTKIRKTENESYGNQEKISDLLNRLLLSDRIIESFDTIEEKMGTIIDYSETDKIIKKEREESIKYLNRSL